MVAFKNLISGGIWKVARNLIRDHSELESLQSSMASERFIEMSVSRAKEVFIKEFAGFKFTSIQFAASYKAATSDGTHVLICPIDSMLNFKRSFPFFGSTILQIKRSEGQESVVAAVISFPVFGQVFFAEKGQGAFVEKYEDSGRTVGRRLRVSAVKNLSDAVVSREFAEDNCDVLTIRDFGSIAYNITSYASGKFDAISVNACDVIHKEAMELFAKESGGVVRQGKGGNFIATNSFLAQSVK